MMNQSIYEQLVAEAAADGVRQLVVGAVIQYGGTILLLQRPTDDFMGGIYELPSGKVEPGEALDAALVREVAEETGLTATEICDYLGFFDYQSGSGKLSRQFNFAVVVAAPKPIVLSEHDDYRWVSLDEEPPVTDAVKTVIAEYRQLQIS